MTMPWFLNRTMTREFHCPWSNRTVTVRFLTFDGRHPVGLISCSERECDLRCLKEAARVEAIPGQEQSEAPAPSTGHERGCPSD